MVMQIPYLHLKINLKYFYNHIIFLYYDKPLFFLQNLNFVMIEVSTVEYQLQTHSI